MKPDKQNGSGGNNRRNLMGLVSIIIWALVITILVNYLTSLADQGSSIEISYSQFRQLVEEHKVAYVDMTATKYTRRTSPKPQPLRPPRRRILWTNGPASFRWWKVSRP